MHLHLTDPPLGAEVAYGGPIALGNCERDVAMALMVVSRVYLRQPSTREQLHRGVPGAADQPGDEVQGGGEARGHGGVFNGTAGQSFRTLHSGK